AVAAVRACFPDADAEGVDLVWDRPIGHGDAPVSLADPPWYPEHTLAFLWAAARQTRAGGRVFLSLPAEGTRPAVLADGEDMLSRAGAFGLRLVSLRRGALAYRTPPFESNALAAAGISGVPSNWRRGDLATFVVGAKPPVPRPTPVAGREFWDEESVGAV